MFYVSIVLLALALLAFFLSIAPSALKKEFKLGGYGFMFCAIITFGFSCFTQVPASHVAVVTTFGKVSDITLGEGANAVLPWQTTHKVFMGMDVAAASKAEAGSKDLQSVVADLTANYHVDPNKARDLYILNPSLGYETAFVVPAMYDVFKGVVAQYTADELITKRNEVNSAIVAALDKRLAQYYVSIKTINLVNFKFSKAFDAAIEEKVTASQKAETAKRNLERVKFEADARIAQAEGEAKAISIQAAAIEKQGGAAYTQLKAIEKWNGTLPTYVTSGSAMPFVNLK